jgi:hypothetical protein
MTRCAVPSTHEEMIARLRQQSPFAKVRSANNPLLPYPLRLISGRARGFFWGRGGGAGGVPNTQYAQSRQEAAASGRATRRIVEWNALSVIVKSQDSLDQEQFAMQLLGCLV